MAETTKTFTTEERIAFEEKYNLGVYSHEALIELLMQFDERLRIQNAENVNGFFDHDKRIQQLEERLMEVAKEAVIEEIAPDTGELYRTTLADKWK